MATITEDEYMTQLRAFITDKMKAVPEGQDLSFWADFNRDRKAEFDASLKKSGITVEPK